MCYDTTYNLWNPVYRDLFIHRDSNSKKEGSNA